MKPTKPQARAAPVGNPAAPHAALLALFKQFNAGQTAAMESSARALAARHPGDGQVWKALGVALLAQRKPAANELQRAHQLLPKDTEVMSALGGAWVAEGAYDRAAQIYQTALELQPNSAALHNNLGDAWARLQRWPQAEASCRRALQLQPTMAAALVNLGHALKGQGQLLVATESYRQATARADGLVEAHRALGIVLREQRLWAQAVASLRRALELQPRHASTLDQLGLALQGQGHHADAMAAFRASLAVDPGLTSAHVHLANAWAEQGQHENAVSSCRQALALQPGGAELHAVLGAALLELRQFDEAVDALRTATELNPALALPYSHMGRALMAQGRFTDAHEQHKKAVALAPRNWVVQAQMGHCLWAMGDAKNALAHIGLGRDAAPERLELHSQALFLERYLPSTPAQRHRSLAGAQRFGTLARDKALPYTFVPGVEEQNRPLRIGFLSGDFRSHPISCFLESFLTALRQRGGCELWAYSNHRSVDATTQRLHACFDKWTPVAEMDDVALAAAIHGDSVDILVELSGHTNHNRLPALAFRPAPVQVSWLGYSGSTGLDSMTAFMGDPQITPHGSEAEFVEPVVRLPETFLCFTPPSLELEPGPLPALCGTGIRFGCFNQLAKITDEVIATWARILHAVTGSQLRLQAAALGDAGVRQSLHARFAAYGVQETQILMSPAQERADYLAQYREIDIALDPFPCPGGTTSLEALWMGVPVLSLAGTTALSRQGLSILHNLGLTDWVAFDTDAYVEWAQRHASDLDALAALREGLRARLLRSALCDAPRFAAHFDQCLRQLWRNWCTGAGHSPRT